MIQLTTFTLKIYSRKSSCALGWGWSETGRTIAICPPIFDR